MDLSPDAVDSIVEEWGERLPSVDATPLHVMGRIQRIAARVDPLLRPPFAAAGLASGDFDVLAALRRAEGPDGLSPTDLAIEMLVTPGAATKRVDRLIAAGLVTRRAAGPDRRAKLVALTSQGRRLTDRLIRTHLRREGELLACLTPEESATLAGLLRTLLRHVESD